MNLPQIKLVIFMDDFFWRVKYNFTDKENNIVLAISEILCYTQIDILLMISRGLGVASGSRQPTLGLNDLCLEVLTIHGNDLRLFVG